MCASWYLGYLQIYVDIPGRKTLTLKLKSTDTIESIKAMIQDEEGIPPDQQRLIYSGKQLENCGTISSYSIKKESKLVLECKQFS